MLLKGNRLTSSAQEVMVNDVLLKLLVFSKLFPFCIRQGNAKVITEEPLFYSMVHVDLFLKEKTYLTRPKHAIATIAVFTRS